MTTLRRVLMATKNQGSADSAHPPLDRKRSSPQGSSNLKKKFEEEQELQITLEKHQRAGHKRKRKEITNGSSGADSHGHHGNKKERELKDGGKHKKKTESLGISAAKEVTKVQLNNASPKSPKSIKHKSKSAEKYKQKQLQTQLEAKSEKNIEKDGKHLNGHRNKQKKQRQEHHHEETKSSSPRSSSNKNTEKKTGAISSPPPKEEQPPPPPPPEESPSEAASKKAGPKESSKTEDKPVKHKGVPQDKKATESVASSTKRTEETKTEDAIGQDSQNAVPLKIDAKLDTKGKSKIAKKSAALKSPRKLEAKENLEGSHAKTKIERKYEGKQKDSSEKKTISNADGKAKPGTEVESKEKPTSNDSSVTSVKETKSPSVSKGDKKRKREELHQANKLSKTPSPESPIDGNKARPPKRSASKNCPGTQKADEAVETKDKPGSLEESKTPKEACWVMCERCKDWKELPSDVKLSSLPEKWYCEMNSWDVRDARCPVLDKDKKKPSKPSGTHGEKSAKKRARASHHEKSGRATNNRSRGKNHGQRPRLNSMMSNAIANSPNRKASRATWKWVMCETCNQWRRVPPEVDLEKLPEKWYCSMNIWDPARASCSAPQEADDVQGKEGAKVEAGRKFVTLPDGVNMYGGQIWPLQRKQPPMNYRELIVNHYRNFKQWELFSSKLLNQRYDGTSLFIPRDVVRVKSSKHGSRKSIATNPDVDCISRNSFIRESLFSKMFPATEKEKDVSTSRSEENDDDGSVFARKKSGLPLLKLSKPWKRAGSAWTADSNYFCSMDETIKEDDL